MTCRVPKGTLTSRLKLFTPGLLPAALAPAALAAVLLLLQEEKDCGKEEKQEEHKQILLKSCTDCLIA